MVAYTHRRELALLLTTVLFVSSAAAQTPLLPPVETSPLPPSANTVPPVNVPSMPMGTPPAPPLNDPAPAPVAAPAFDQLPVAPAAAVTEPAAAPPPAPAERPATSMGSSATSLLFTPKQVETMRDALQSYESKQAANPNADFTVTESSPATPAIVEPTTYPVFYLSSIAYRNAGDWTIWVSGHKITSHKNTTTLKVLSVSPNSVQLAWTPSYTQALSERKQRNLFAPLEPVKNKLTKPSSYAYDDKLGVVTFSLRPNQSFSAGYMNTFEGYIASPQLPKLQAEEAKGAANNTAATSAGDAAAPGIDQQGLLNRKPTALDSLNAKAARSEIDSQLKRPNNAR